MVQLEEINSDPYTDMAGSEKPVIGLAGGIGAGKSTVAEILGTLGAVVISSDEISRQELESNEVTHILRQWWGDEIMDPDGRVNRRKVADIAFADPTQKRRLESLLHPRVMARRERRMADARRRPEVRAIVIDSPLLYETGLDLLCDAVIFVDAPLDQRQARVQAARGWSPEELARRENLQQPLSGKRARADHVCQNFGDSAELRRQVVSIFSGIVSSRRGG